MFDLSPQLSIQPISDEGKLSHGRRDFLVMDWEDWLTCSFSLYGRPGQIVWWLPIMEKFERWLLENLGISENHVQIEYRNITPYLREFVMDRMPRVSDSENI